MLNPSKFKLSRMALAGVAVSALALAALPAAAQTSGTAGSAGTSSTAAGSGASTAADAGKLARADKGMLDDLAQANIAEVETGKLALEKSQSAEVKKFAQHMVDDHSSALAEVQALARAKGVTLPDGPGAVAKTKATALKAMSGNLFDKEYAKRAGVDDHEATVKLLNKIQKDAKDADLKALAGKMLPKVEGHLEMAKAMAPAK
jgi:putative membrane protein